MSALPFTAAPVPFKKAAPLVFLLASGPVEDERFNATTRDPRGNGNRVIGIRTRVDAALCNPGGISSPFFEERKKIR